MWDNSGNHFQLLFVFAAPQCLPLRACSVEYPPPLTNSHSCFLHPCNFSLASFLLFYFFPTKQKKTFGCRFSLTLVLFIKTTDTQGSAPQGKYVNWKYILLILGAEILFSQSATDAPFTLDKRPTTIWLLSSAGGCAICIHSLVKWLYSSHGYLLASALISGDGNMTPRWTH